MSDRSARSRWFSEQPGLTALTLITATLATLIILPYLQYVLLGVVLAYILAPAQRRLERAVGSMTAALTLVAVAILAILLPVMYVLAIALRQALEVLTAIQEGTLDMDDVERQLAETGYVVDLGELYETYQEPIGTMVQGLATSGIELVSGLPGVLIGLTVTLFVLFALLRDGERLVAWTQRVLPVDDDIQRELHSELDQLMWASVVGNVVVAAIQAIALGIGLAVLGIPAVVFLTVATFVLALLPLVGAFGIWVPVVLYLLATGDFVGATALTVYGSLVSASDTYLRPALIGRTSAFNSAIVVVGIFGGIVVFGAVGLFIGPVVLGGAKVTLDVFARERDRGTGTDPALEDERAADAAVDTAADTGIGAETATPDSGGSDGAAHEEPLETDADADDLEAGGDSDTDSNPELDANADEDTSGGAETDTDSSH
ncbi:AI-2E family transporter [Natronorubrum sp. JWXQ-INN-674]|uniref:AI-2E family transporter n=1 Tax=Natronorubrum halalkaliphilum TaxID=2691917 RepID=A0A6B0VGZ5_9EURY|nr:AI-2E family transporter [Natronorubrum halalkaliphilum]MXV60764.1 AI-2E family transporter [Natronorubrum halalkaliphilum]